MLQGVAADTALRERLAGVEAPPPPSRAGAPRGIVTSAGDAGMRPDRLPDAPPNPVP
jgi:hypothetical protein